MRVAFWGTFDLGKPRNRILLRGLQENDVEVLLCHRQIWAGVEDKSRLTAFERLRFLSRVLLAYPGLLLGYLRLPRHDAVLVGYLGQLDVMVLWLFARLRRVPVVWDAFLSLVDTVVDDRALVSPRHPLARLLFAWEWLASRAADRVLLDTRSHAEAFAAAYRLPRNRVAAVFVGAEPEAFPAGPPPARVEGHAPVRVLFYGQLIPLHGVETILRAARAAREEPFDWTLIGQGQQEQLVRRMLAEVPLPRLRWIPWVPYEELARWIGEADVCLGIFGASGKAARVIPNKVFQAVAAGKPLVTRDSPAIRELLGEGCGVYLVPPDDPEGLLEALRRLRAESGALAGKALHAAARERIQPKAIGRELLKILESLLSHDPLFGLTAPGRGWVPAPRYALRRARVLALAGRLGGGRLLEVGPGAGALLSDLAALGFACEALETSEEAFRLTSELIPGVRIVPAPVADWSVAFDVLVACEVLEHIADDRAALEEWRGWLRPGGHLILSVPAHARRWSATDVWAGHFRRYEKDDLRKLLESAGFAVLELECYGFPLSNLIEPLRAWSHRHALRRREGAGLPEATAQSGVERGLEVRLWPLQASLPGRLLFRAALRLQKVFRNRDLGTGYLVLARRICGAP